MLTLTLTLFLFFLYNGFACFPTRFSFFSSDRDLDLGYGH